MIPAFTRASLGVLLCAAAFGQAASNPPARGFPARPTFEVASVKPAARRPAGGGERAGGGDGAGGGGCPTSWKVDRSRVDVRCATIAMLIGYAFRISPDRIAGPDWMMGAGSPRFDIAAKIPQDAPEHQVPEMFQSLLADRFKLAFHRGSKNGAAYRLVVEKGGLKLKGAVPEAGAPLSAPDPDAPHSIDGFFGAVQTRTTANADGRSSTTTISSPRMGTVRETGDPFGIQRWEAPSISLAGLAELLDKVTPLSSPVIDMTGLKGRFQMVLEVSLRDARPGVVSAGGGPTAVEGPGTEMEEAVLKGFNDGLRKLGLKLERRKGTVEAVVVDHAEKTPTGN